MCLVQRDFWVDSHGLIDRPLILLAHYDPTLDNLRNTYKTNSQILGETS